MTTSFVSRAPSAFAMEGIGYVDGLLAAYVMAGFIVNMQKFFPAPIWSNSFVLWQEMLLLASATLLDVAVPNV